MLIGGLQKTSLLDFPGKISAIVFTAGCNFRCGYCHNPELIKQVALVKDDIFAFLQTWGNIQSSKRNTANNSEQIIYNHFPLYLFK